MAFKFTAEQVVEFASKLAECSDYVVFIEFPVEEAQAMKALRSMVDSLITRSDGRPKRLALLQPARDVVDILLRGAGVNPEKTRVAFYMFPEGTAAIRGVIGHLHEYQLLAEHDAAGTSKPKRGKY